MRTFSVLAVAASILASASAHYHVDSFNGDTASLRQHSRSSGDIDSPITGSAIDTDDLICGVNRPLSTTATPITVTAGSTVKAHWNPNVFHIGPSSVYASRALTSPFSWSKVYEQGYLGNDKWSSDAINANGNTLSFTIPSGMANGRWVLRIEHLALHQAGTKGGAQFYVRCVDINVVGGGSSIPSGGTIPGLFTSSTNGVIWNP
ncbi:hypothetical protein HDV00_000424 [Rhizophlyctis rosea]|nr:hypothetical protein HDV00_000424 [Rhizophlyctis rosea]